MGTYGRRAVVAVSLKLAVLTPSLRAKFAVLKQNLPSFPELLYGAAI